MTLAVVVFVVGLTGISSVVVIRRRAARRWAQGLKVFRIHLPADLQTDDVARWLGMVSASTAVPQWTTRPPTVLGLEVRASARGIAHYLLVPGHGQTAVLQSVRAGLSGARLESVPDGLADDPGARYARELRLTSTRRPLATDRAEAVATAFLNSLQPLTAGQAIRFVWYFAGAGSPSVATGDDADADARRALHAKQAEPLLLATARIGASASTKRLAKVSVLRSGATLRGMNAPGSQVAYRWLQPSWLVVGRMARRALPLSNWLPLNAKELSGLIGLPIGEAYVAGLAMGVSRQLPPSPTAPRSGLILARSTYQGTGKLLRLTTADRLRHLWLLGPTGTGKSTLIANMALQDAAAGHGFALIDPKGDLVADVLVRLPESRHDDVIVLDPTAYVHGQPIIGLNVLGHATSEYERELATDQIVHIMHSIWADSWGPRTSDVLRNALLTLAHTTAIDGSAFTLVEVAPLLENTGFRRFVTTQPGIPKAVRPFWTAYESYSDAQRLQIIAPSLNKLRALGTRTPLRLMFGQSVGISVADVLNSGKILLVPLSKGSIGMETAELLGSLVVSSLVDAIFARAAMPAAHRHPAWIYLDEFQDVLRLPLDIADALAQARGLGVGFVLVNQYLGQLPEQMKRAALGTVRSTVLFQLDLDDAKVFDRRFSPLTASDLTHLPVYEIAARLCEHNTTTRPVTGVTLPLPDPQVDGAAVAHRSASRYGVLREDVEAAIRIRTMSTKTMTRTTTATPFGRRKVGGDQ